MGIDLTICPIQHNRGDWWLANNRLRFERDYDLFGKIGGAGFGAAFPGPAVVETNPIPRHIKFDWYDDSGIKQTSTDAYGAQLTCAYASQFKQLLSGYNESKWNKAILTFLAALPRDTIVVLYWS